LSLPISLFSGPSWDPPLTVVTSAPQATAHWRTLPTDFTISMVHVLQSGLHIACRCLDARHLPTDFTISMVHVLQSGLHIACRCLDARHPL